MPHLTINGGHRLNGAVSLQGAKNSTLPILAATLVCGDESIIHNCPNITDVDASLDILRSLGCKCTFCDNTVTVDSATAHRYSICDSLMSEMRSSVIFLGALLAVNSRAELCAPGGCELGLRPINLHIDAFRRMGARIVEEHGRLICIADGGLRGCVIDLPVASVGATENIMIAATTAVGDTVIRNAAKEPEICDLADYLRKCGAKISGDGGAVITVSGVKKLRGCEHYVIPDRIVAATYLSAVSVCGGDVYIDGANEAHLVSVLPCFEQMGCEVTSDDGGIRIVSKCRPERIGTVRTAEYPGFPTDAQPVLLAAASVADGTSIFVENIFSNRFRYVSELGKMGARISVVDRVAVVDGVRMLTSANVTATDLRGGAAMVIAALGADGTSTVSSIAHIERGYEDIARSFRALGADIERES